MWTLTCTFGSAHKRGPRWSGSSLPRPSQQHTDVVLRVGIQVPQLIGDHVDSMHLWPGRLAGAVLNLFPDNGAISQDRVGVELDDQVSGAGTQQLGRRDGGRRYWERKWKRSVLFFSSHTNCLLTGPWHCCKYLVGKIEVLILLISCIQTDYIKAHWVFNESLESSRSQQVNLCSNSRLVRAIMKAFPPKRWVKKQLCLQLTECVWSFQLKDYLLHIFLFNSVHCPQSRPPMMKKETLHHPQ